MCVQASFVIHQESETVNVIECDGIGLNNKAFEPSTWWHRAHRLVVWLVYLYKQRCISVRSHNWDIFSI